jgi:hypothetical protein
MSHCRRVASLCCQPVAVAGVLYRYMCSDTLLECGVPCAECGCEEGLLKLLHQYMGLLGLVLEVKP